MQGIIISPYSAQHIKLNQNQTSNQSNRSKSGLEKISNKIRKNTGRLLGGAEEAKVSTRCGVAT